MKRTILVVLILSMLLLCSCENSEDEVLVSLGEYECEGYYMEGVWQDFTIYAKYSYKNADFEDTPYFEQITDETESNFIIHMDDFESWIDLFRDSEHEREIVKEYDFDRAVVDNEDYIYIDSEEHNWDDGNTSLVNYNVYFF